MPVCDVYYTWIILYKYCSNVLASFNDNYETADRAKVMHKTFHYTSGSVQLSTSNYY